MTDFDPGMGGQLPMTAQLDASVMIHSVEFRMDGSVEISYSETAQMTDKAVMVKQITAHPDLIDDEEMGVTLDTLRDWVDRVWEHLRGVR